MTSAPGLARARRSARQPVRAAYSRSDGSSPDAIRSRWIRSAMTTSASRSAVVDRDVTVNRRPAAAPATRPRLEPAQERRPGRTARGRRRPRSASRCSSARRANGARRRGSRPCAPRRDAARQPRSQRVQVEQRLGRVGVPAVAAVEDRAAEVSAARYGAPDAAWRMTSISRPERLDRPDRVDERLALRDRRARRGDVDDVGRQVLGGDLEQTRVRVEAS